MDQELKAFALSMGIDQIGIVSARCYDEAADKLRPKTPFCERYSSEKRVNPFLSLPDAQSIVVYLLPYYDGKNPPHNLSRYAWGRDYHEVAAELSEQFHAYFRAHYPSYQGRDFCDITPLPQKHLAYLAGLGFFGEHHLLINETYGTWFFIAHIVTNLYLPADKPQKRECQHCGRCRVACPTGVLTRENADFYRCISAITQKPSLAADGTEMAFRYSIWGCDRCQEVCPFNEKAAVSPLLSHFGTSIPFIEEHTPFPTHRAYSYKKSSFMRQNLAWYSEEHSPRQRDSSERPD